MNTVSEVIHRIDGVATPNAKRRQWLLAATSAMGGAGLLVTAYPFIASFEPVASRLFMDPFNEQFRLLVLPSHEGLNGGSVTQGALRDAVVVGREVELQCGLQLCG